ncbi:MAG: single-stranded DNA-binding protein [Saprospiraceae bacterium]|jgi:single-strand DNA-binding protein
MVNKVILIGNLGKDPEIRRLESGAVVAKFSIATSESYRDKDGNWQEQTEWHDIVAWRALAERAEQSLKKGMTIYLEGKLTHRTWQDQEGKNRKTTEVVADYFRILDRKQSGQQAGSAQHPEPSLEPGGAENDLPF